MDPTLVTFIVWVFLAFWTALHAGSKNRSMFGWLLLAALFGPFALLFVFYASDRSHLRASEHGVEAVEYALEGDRLPGWVQS
jgi:hypothetical protein